MPNSKFGEALSSISKTLGRNLSKNEVAFLAKTMKQFGHPSLMQALDSLKTNIKVTDGNKMEVLRYVYSICKSKTEEKFGLEDLNLEL